MRILLISAPIGAGHTRAAHAVAEALKRQNKAIETEIVDVFSFIAPKYGQAILRGYLRILESVPKLYSRMYSWGNTNGLALWGRELVSRFLAKKMYAYIKDYLPTVIVCTHATPAGIAAYLLKRQLIDIPVVAVVTDYVVHRLWIYPEIHQYFVADDILRRYLVTEGVPFERSRATGIPVDHLFRLPVERSHVLKRFGFDEKLRTILIMGGGAGLLPMEELVMACERIKDTLQIIVITGKNTSLYQRLQKKTALRHTLCVLGYVDTVHEVMAAVDVLITKPGGMTTAEALCRRLPMILYRPIPGQEEANARYLLNKGAALCAHSADEVASVLESMLTEPNRLCNFKKSIALLKRPLAADEIAQNVVSQSFP